MTREQREEFNKLAKRLQLSDKQQDMLDAWFSDILTHQSEVARRQGEYSITMAMFGKEWP